MKELGKLVINDKEWFKHKCVPVTEQNEIDMICATLDEALDIYPNGAGLAANQLGFDKRIAIIIRDNGERMLLVNPIVVARSKETVKSIEGCLSFPHAKVAVRRNATITVKITPDSEPETFVGHEGIVLQHELAHLEGRTMWDFAFKQVSGSKFTQPKKKRKKRRK